MSGTDWREQLPLQVRVLQIIIGALSLGCIFFAVIVIVAAKTSFKNAGNQLDVTYIALAMAGLIFVLCIFLPHIIVSQGRKNILRTIFPAARTVSDSDAGEKREDENRVAQPLTQLLQTKTIVAGALLEGAIFFLLIAYMIERSNLSLLAAAALLILLIAQMPTMRRVTNWIENQLRLIAEERLLR